MINYFRKRECRKVRELFSEYLNGNLSQSDIERVGCHLARCKECLTEFHSLKETIRLLHKLSPEVTSPPFVISKIDERIPAPKSWVRKLSISTSIILVLALGTWAALLNFGGEQETNLPQSEEPKIEMVAEDSSLEGKEAPLTKVSVVPLAGKEGARPVPVKELIVEEKTFLDHLKPEQGNSVSPYHREIKLGNFILGFGYEEGLSPERREGVPPGRITSLIAHLQEICPCSPLHVPPGQISKALKERR